MKTGILTFNRAYNYGAVLQCYALQEILKRRGLDVYVIDYRQPWIDDFYKTVSWNQIRRNSGSLKGLFSYLKGNLKKFMVSPFRRCYFNSFTKAYLRLTEPADRSSIPSDMDCYVIGSDQLWSLHCLGGQLDPVYMGDFHHNADSSVVGYAISADKNSILSSAAVIKSSYSNFTALSMREKEIADKVSEIAGSPCEVCMDPTLLTDADLWEPVINDKWKSRKYILVYEVRWKKETRNHLRRKAEELAARIGKDCEIIVLSGMRYPVGDFVSMFKYAAYVVTTSFHGVVFSLLFERPFYAFPLWDGYDLRYRELLESVGAADRLLQMDDEVLPTPMDFAPVKKLLSDRRKDSFDFIDKFIK